MNDIQVVEFSTLQSRRRRVDVVGHLKWEKRWCANLKKLWRPM